MEETHSKFCRNTCSRRQHDNHILLNFRLPYVINTIYMTKLVAYYNRDYTHLNNCAELKS